MKSALKATFDGTGMRPKCAPDLRFPNGITADLTNGRKPSCSVELTYPAPSVGKWFIECPICGFTGILTAASRPDDPKLVIVHCKVREAPL